MLSENQTRLLKQILERENEKHPVIAVHALDQPLVDELCAIILAYEKWSTYVIGS